MNTMKKSLFAVAIAAAFVSSNAQAAFLNDWFIDTNGNVAGGDQLVISEGVKTEGTALVTNVFSDASHFTFNEAATFTAFGANTPTVNFTNDLRGEFTGTGSGVVGSPLGTLSFNSGGTLKLYDSANINIGIFSLVSGSAALAGGSVLPNGLVSLAFKAISLEYGYFFTDATKNVDLASIVDNPTGLLFGFATTNASLVTGQSAIAGVVGANQTLYTDTFGAAFDPTNAYGMNTLALENGGQYRFQVPEPGSLALLGLGLLGVGMAGRRKLIVN